MSVWIGVFAGFVALAIIAVSMAGLFYLLTKATENNISSINSENNLSADEDETMHF